jgi:hypothetical protein
MPSLYNNLKTSFPPGHFKRVQSKTRNIRQHRESFIDIVARFR